MNAASPYDSFDDPYCYEHSAVLKNILDLRDAAQLENFELEMTALRAEEALPSGKFDPAHYRAIHHHFFQDVYAWAGEYRTVRTAKGGNMFCYPDHIAGEMDRLFPMLQSTDFLEGASSRAFVSTAAVFLGELNAIHPFREGNGRTQLSFLALLGDRAGHALDMTRIRPAAMFDALVTSFSGGVEPLENEIAHLAETR